MSGSTIIAAIANREGRDPQASLSTAAIRWHDAGVRVAGVIAEAYEGEGICSAGFLRDIVTGRTFPIHFDNPPEGTSCHLDARGVDGACEELLPQIEGAELIVLSKFGKLESMKKGLWPVFSAAAAAGTPLLTTVSSRFLDAWNAWAPAAVWIEPDEAEIEKWRHGGAGVQDGDHLERAIRHGRI